MLSPEEVLDLCLAKAESDRIYKSAHVWQDYASAHPGWINRFGSFSPLTREMLRDRNYTVTVDAWGNPLVHYHDQKFDPKAREQGRNSYVWVAD